MILEAENIFYSAESKQILKDINLEAIRGDILGITGESGSGKTTLAKVIAGLLNPDSGKLKLRFRQRQADRISRVQILFQNNGDIINPYRKGIDIIRETAERRFQKDAEAEIERIKKAIGLSDEILNRRGLELSGGEQQRMALARLLAAGPEMLILDEPFSAQDPESQQNLISVFRNINTDYDITLICISHFIGILRHLCRNIAVMYNGTIIEKKPVVELFRNPEHPYTKYLLSAEEYKLSPAELLHWRDFGE
jgi:oligopeptide transport system ATP-binding protein